MSTNSYREILRSTAITGGASLVNIVLGLVRIKFVAVLLGPTGIGLLGVYTNLVTVVSNLASLGMVNAGTREIARAQEDENSESLLLLRRTLTWGMLASGFIGATIFWCFRELISSTFSNSTITSSDMVWLALAVLLITASGAQISIINGLRRIDYLAKISISSSVASTLIGIAGIIAFGVDGLLLLVLLGPIATYLLGRLFAGRLEINQVSAANFNRHLKVWQGLVRIGVAFMLASLAVPIGQLIVRALVQQELGPNALGLIHASWVVSTIYTGLVLNAMAADFFPKLSAAVKNSEITNRLVNEQTEIALLIISPILVAALGLAPWLMDFFYTRQFGDAAKILRWQILGDILKVASWPIGFILIASGDTRAVLFSEFIGACIFCVLTWVGLGNFGIQSVGFAYLGMYIAYTPLVYFLAQRKTGFRWSRSVSSRLLVLSVLVIGIFLAAISSRIMGGVLSVGVGSILTASALVRLQAIGALPANLDRLVLNVRIKFKRR